MIFPFERGMMAGLWPKVLANASTLTYIHQTDEKRVFAMDMKTSICALRLLQSADEFRDRLSGEFAAVHGISVNEFLLLMHLDGATRHRLPRAELARRMNVSGSTVTRMVAPMEKTGIVTRELDDRDARYAFVAITEAGLTKLKDAQATFEKQASYLFQDRWDDAEVDGLSELLFRLVAGASGNLT